MAVRGVEVFLEGLLEGVASSRFPPRRTIPLLVVVVVVFMVLQVYSIHEMSRTILCSGGVVEPAVLLVDVVVFGWVGNER